MPDIQKKITGKPTQLATIHTTKYWPQYYQKGEQKWLKC